MKARDEAIVNKAAIERVLAGVAEHLSRDVRSAMVRKKMTQTLLARRMRTSRSTVIRLLMRRRAPQTLRSLVRLSKALGGTLSVSLPPGKSKRR